MRQKKVEGEYQPDSWPKRPWTKAMPPRTTRYCDGPRVPNRSMVGTRLTTPHDPSFAGRARIVPRRINNGVQNHEFVRVLDGLRDDLADRRPPGLGCQCQRHRGMGKSALDIPLHRRIWAGVSFRRIPHPDSSTRSFHSLAQNDKRDDRAPQRRRSHRDFIAPIRLRVGGGTFNV